MDAIVFAFAIFAPIWDTIQQILFPDSKEPLKYIGNLLALLSFVVASLSLSFTVFKEFIPWIKAKIQSRLISHRLGQDLYPPMYVESAIRFYIPPDCQNLDPAGEEEPRNQIAVRQQLFEQIETHLSQGKYKYMILLADSGMGKTCALINFYRKHARRWWRRKYDVALFPIGIHDLAARLEKIPQQHQTVLLLDAFDEDIEAGKDYKRRLKEILKLTEGFRAIIISCRTQFFSKDEEIPIETGMMKFYPVDAGESKEYVFYKIYLSPFSDPQVSQYLKKRYPFWKIVPRHKAWTIVNKIPDLSVRPMLLAHIGELMKSKGEIMTSADIYEVMIEAWLTREKDYAKNKEALRLFSMNLAYDLFTNSEVRKANHITPAELARLTEKWGVSLPDKQLKQRSLLNRYGEGNLKFSHRSFMEYLFVKHFLSLPENQRRKMKWTDQMKKFLIEIAGQSIPATNSNVQQTKELPQNLQFVDLSNADIRLRRFNGVHFDNADLTKAKCSNSSFIKCTFVLAEAVEADFTESDLSKADFSRANLTDANMRGTITSEIIFTDAIQTRLLTSALASDYKTGGSTRRRKIIKMPRPFSSELGIDLGTSNTLIFARGVGIVVAEPSVVAINKLTHKIEAIGAEAKQMLGRTPPHIEVISPVKEGMITDFEVTETMLRYFLRKAHNGRRWVSSRVVMGVSPALNQNDRQVIEDCAYRATSSEVYLVSNPMAAAIGAGLPITGPEGNMIVVIGGGITDIAVVSLSGIVYSQGIRVAGKAMDDAIIQYIKRKYRLFIGERTAEEIKIYLGSATPLDEELTMEINGRSLIDGTPKTIVVTDEEIHEALAEPVFMIVKAIRTALDSTPPELSGDIVDRGIVLAGGGAMLKGLDTRLWLETGLSVSIAEDTLSSVVHGLGITLTDFNFLKRMVQAASIPIHNKLG